MSDDAGALHNALGCYHMDQPISHPAPLSPSAKSRGPIHVGLHRWISSLVHNKLYWASLMGLPWVASAIYLLRHRVNGDVAWYLYAAQRLIEGARLYIDVYDMNMPLAYYIGEPFVVVGGLLGIPPYFVLYCAVWVFLAAALWGLYKVLRTFSAMNRTTALLFILMIAAVALGRSRADFGQRDQYVGIAFLVLAQHLYARIHGRPVAGYTMLALAGLLIAIKPFFLLPWLLMLLWTAWRTSVRGVLRSPEFWLIAGITGSLGIAAVTFTSYLTVAAVAARYYGAYNSSMVHIASDLRLVFFAAMLGFIWTPAGKLRDLARLSALAAAGFAVEVIIQNKGYAYHDTPAKLWAYITLSVLVIDLLQRGGVLRKIVSIRPSAAILAISLMCALLPLARAVRDGREQSEVGTFVKEHASGQSILPLSTNLWTEFPTIVEANAKNALPEPGLWTIPGLYRDQLLEAKTDRPARFHSRAEMNKQEKQTFDRVVQAMLRLRPTILLVQPASRGQALGNLSFDFLQYFSMDERFKDALTHYVKGPSDEITEVYLRKD